MPAYTTNFNWYLPTVGSDTNIWGGYIDSNWTSIDDLLRDSINCFIANTAPSVAQTGTLWLNNTTNPYSLNIYDGTNWVAIGTLNTTSHTFTSASSQFYIGDMKFSAQTADHGNWILCNGQSLSTTTYSGLFAIIGYSFGGSGASFSAPDLRGQVAGAIGTGSYTGASTRTMGEFDGEETHTLDIAEMPTHNHTDGRDAFYNLYGGGSSTGTKVFSSGAFATFLDANTSSTGGSGAHNNMQPTLFVGNYFIYSGV